MGMPASRKSAISDLLTRKLIERSLRIEYIDYDVYVPGWCSETGLVHFCQVLNRHNVIALVSLESLDDKIRSTARKELKYFIEFLWDSADTPEQSVAKIILKLEEMGFLEPTLSDYTDEEKAEIDERLKNLGYM
jgi:adenylylsulfate kinase-like enzyme